jgi:hypothetical protein
MGVCCSSSPVVPRGMLSLSLADMIIQFAGLILWQGHSIQTPFNGGSVISNLFLLSSALSSHISAHGGHRALVHNFLQKFSAAKSVLN